jgi:hypothetical protein
MAWQDASPEPQKNTNTEQNNICYFFDYYNRAKQQAPSISLPQSVGKAVAAAYGNPKAN